MSEDKQHDQDVVKRSSDRRQASDTNYTGPERRVGERRSAPRERT